jgi:hypothetical protein
MEVKPPKPLTGLGVDFLRKIVKIPSWFGRIDSQTYQGLGVDEP